MTHDTHHYGFNPIVNILFGFASLLLTSIDYAKTETVVEGILKIAVLSITLFTLIRNLRTKPNNKQDGKEINVDID
jgi:hypothetical protein